MILYDDSLTLSVLTLQKTQEKGSSARLCRYPRASSRHEFPARCLSFELSNRSYLPALGRISCGLLMVTKTRHKCVGLHDNQARKHRSGARPDMELSWLRNMQCRFSRCCTRGRWYMTIRVTIARSNALESARLAAKRLATPQLNQREHRA